MRARRQGLAIALATVTTLTMGCGDDDGMTADTANDAAMTSTEGEDDGMADATVGTGDTTNGGETGTMPGDAATIEIQANETNLVMVNVWTPNEGVTVDEVASAVAAGIEADIAPLPGFLVAAVHASQDESNVLVYGHWTGADALAGVQEVLEAGEAPDFAAALGLAESVPHPYDVRSVDASGPLVIAEGSTFLTMVNTWTPNDGATVDDVATALVAAIGDEISTVPGFLGGSVHASTDESNVLVYGQWEDEAALGGVMAGVEAGDFPLFAQAAMLAGSVPHPYAVQAVIAAP